VLSWLESTALATWTRESPSIWAYPAILTLHTLGLAIVVGSSSVVDVRLLGFGRDIPLGRLAGLFHLIWGAFALNAATGVLLFAADATVNAQQPVLYVKLATVGLALWVTVRISRLLGRDGEARIESVRGRRLAAGSLLLWTGAIAAGRLMAYL
jgi:hypothetical protein